ncbi:hypothetical protein HU733_02455 [Pseudomonas paralactis]|uniref:hypothetical protein n=1 Tax=Pseudomonas paralactis TaxID=1615673 RepID=UPI0016464D37|nr:hypothetical protein [Pseudomonas paralactis]MBC3254342.1 hypothetical protein [Pseudomonas paralactis]
MTTNQTIDGVPRAYDVESAARTLAECMDYSWDHMPEKGRGAIREYVALIIAAALPGNAEQPAPVAVVLPDVDDLAQIIRKVDGTHSLGAGALAESILDELKRLNPSL